MSPGFLIQCSTKSDFLIGVGNFFIFYLKNELISEFNGQNR